MKNQEEILSLDLEDSDYLYRVRKGKQIIYVSVHLDIVLKCDRTDSSRIIARLNDIQNWDGKWRTLTVTKTCRGISSHANLFQPHYLSQLLAAAGPGQYYNFLDLGRILRISDRVSIVHHKQEVFVLKIARFKHELQALSNEIRAYVFFRPEDSSICRNFVDMSTKKRRIG
jgi:hypothetical protein